MILVVLDKSIWWLVLMVSTSWVKDRYKWCCRSYV